MKLFVWDFHGTLERGNEFAVLETSNLALQELGYKQRFSENDCQRLYGKNWFEYFEDLLPDESRRRHFELQSSAFRISNDQQEIIARYIKPNNYAHEVLEAIAQSQHEQILISNTLPESLVLFLKVVGMAGYFPNEKAFAVNSNAKDTKRTKRYVLEEFIEGKSFERIVSIGDSSDDVALAAEKGISYLYSHPEIPFRDCPADYRIRDLREVLREV